MSPAGDLPEALPDGWSEQFCALKTGRKVKCYVNAGTGQKFFSKDDLMRHFKARKPQLEWPRPPESPIGCPSKANQMQLIEYKNEHPEWLPHNWILGLKFQASGRKYKCYIEPLTGRKFFSKPEVLRHLRTLGQKGCTSGQIETLTNGLLSTKIPSQHPESKAKFENSTVEDLPEGWIKETRIQMKANGIRKDPFYIDPASGYAFHSKKDARRYLETGDITACKILPKKRDVNDQILSSSAAKSPKLEHLSTRQQLMGQGNSDGVSSDNDSFGGGDTAVSTFPNVNVATSEKAASALVNVTAATTDSLREMADKSANALISFPAATMTEVSSQKIPSDSDAESNKNSNAKLAVPTRVEVSMINQVQNANTDFGHGILVSQAVKKQEQNHESGIRRDEWDSAWNSLTKSHCTKGINMSHRASKRLAGIEPQVPANSVSIMQLISKVDNQQDKTCSENGMEGPKCFERSLNNSINHKGHNSYHWTADRLAIISRPIANAISIVQALPKTTKSLKGEAILAAGATEHGLADKPTEQVVGEPVKDLLLHADVASTPLVVELPNTSQKSNTTCPVEPKAKGLGLYGMVNTEDGPVSIPEIDTMQEQKSRKSGWKSRNHLKNCNSLGTRRNKKAFNFPRRSSKRLAALEPELVANVESSEQTLQNAKRSCKNESCEAVRSAPEPCAADEQIKEIKLRHASTTVHNSFHGTSVNKNEVPLPSQSFSEDQSWMLEANKPVDEKSESKLMASFGELLSDPCLEFAFKTLTGEIPIEITAKNMMVSTAPADIIDKGTMLLSKRDKRSDGKTPIKLRKYKANKKVHLPHQTPEFEHKSVAKASSNDCTFGIAARKSSQIEAVMDVASTSMNSAVGASEQFKTSSEAEFRCYDSADVKTMLQSETSINRTQYLDDYSIDEKNDNKAELPPFFSHGDCWSDPCFEFAYKTLTGTIPVEYNLPVQSYFQQQADTSQTLMGSCFNKPVDTHTARDSSLELPDFGLPGYFQTDISVHFDAPDKQLTSQPQVPWSSPSFMPSGIVSVPSCTSIGSQQEAHLKEQKGLRGKVNS